MAGNNLNDQAIFEAARKIALPKAREVYLRQVCGEDQALQQRVTALLLAYQENPSFLELPPPGLQTSPTIGLPSAERPGAQIGPYKLLQQIGEGGMGVVYMAEQKEPVERRVALKIIKPGMDSRQVIARFEAERQALAMMDHPNIAKVLDAGTTESGRPYFVMELVKGQPITQYCDEHHLTPRQRLELLLPVCQATQHAHQKGIIHRDIKPTNILVAEYDQKAVPKVIDFGVAKATSQALTEKTMFTGFGQIVGTLEYMSPEQAKVNQLDIDTRSDIYSLGVLLYELLTGSTPFDKHRLRSAAWDEMLRIIREEEPERPSTRLSSADTLPSIAANRSMEPARLGRTIRGELDWIVMKALEKDRNRRYETASNLAADLQRYLNDEPVQACPPSAAYRLRKFSRRNKSGLAVVALALTFLVLLGSAIGWAVRDRSARAAEAVRLQRERQSKVAVQVETILAEVDRLVQQQQWPEALAAARQADAAVAGGEADEAIAERVRTWLKDLQFIDRLEQIRMQRAMQVEGRFDYAGAHREYAQAFRDYGVDVETLVIERAIEGLKARPALAIPLAAALDNWVEAQRITSPTDGTGLKRLVTVARGIDPEPLRDQFRATWGRRASEVQDELLRLADTIDVQAQHPATLVSLARLLERVGHSDAAHRVLREAQHIHPGDFWLNLEFANALADRKDNDGAIRFFTAAVAIRPNASIAHNSLGVVILNRSILARQNKPVNQNNLDEVIRYSRKAVELDPKNPQTYKTLGLALYEQGKVDEAILFYRKAIELDPRFVSAYTSLGNALSQGEPDDAICAYRKAIEVDPMYANAHHGLGIVLLNQNKLDEAEARFRKVIELDPNHVPGLSMLGKTLVRQNKLDEAVGFYRKAIALDPQSSIAHYGLGFALRGQGNDDEAMASYRRASELDPKWAMPYMGLGNALSRRGKCDEALAAYREAIELDPNLSMGYQGVGNVLSCKGDWDGAITAYRKAIELNPRFGFAFNGLGNALSRQGKLDEAAAAYRTAIQLEPEPNAHIGLGHVAWALANHNDPILRDPKRAIGWAKEVVEVAPQWDFGWQVLGWIEYRAGNWNASIEALDKSCKLQAGGTGDAFQWIVLALSHARLAAQKELPAEEQARHEREARRFYEQADKIITGRWRSRPSDSLEQSVWDFHAEATELMPGKEPEK